MSATRTNKSTGTRTNRPRVAKRSKQSKGVHSHNVSGRSGRRRTNGSTSKSNCANILNPTIAPIQLFVPETESLFNTEAYPQEQICHIVENLYRILKHTPGFEDNREWKELPSLPELASYLMQEAFKQFQDRFSYRYTTDNELRFLVYEVPPHLDNTFVLPLEFIPMLEQKIGYKLYNLLMRAIASIAQQFNLNVVYNQFHDYVLEDIDAHLIGEDLEDGLLRLHVNSYKKGAAKKFKDQIRDQEIISSDDLLYQLNSFQAYNTRLKKSVKKWLTLAAIALKEPVNIHGYFFTEFWHEDEDSIHTVNAEDMYAFAWSFHDFVYKQSEDFYQSAGENGDPIVGPMIRTEYFPNRMPKQSGKIKPVEALANFLEYGRKLYFTHFDASIKKHYIQQSTGDLSFLI